MTNILKKINMKNVIWIVIGVFLMAFSYYFFFAPSDLCYGGVSGIAIILRQSPLGNYSWYKDWMFFYTAQAILAVCAVLFVGKSFFWHTILACILDPTFNLIFSKIGFDSQYFLQIIPQSNWYVVTMLVGGAMSAIGIGLCLRVNASTGGMDIIQKILQQKFHIPYSKSMYLTDWFIVLISGFFIPNICQKASGLENIHVYNIEMVLYGMITVFITGYICDYLALNARKRRTAFIICDDPTIIKDYIFNEFDRGLTIVNAIGGYTNNPKKMIVCTIEKAQCYILRDKIKELDPKAFTFFAETKEIVGEYDN